jgi:hypothetical protein
VQLLSGGVYEIEVFESCCILNVRRMLGIQLRKNGWGNHFNDDLIRFYSDDCQSIDDDHFVEENEHYHVVIREDIREDPEVLLSFENGHIVFREFHSGQLLATNQSDEKNDDDDLELLQSDGRVSWFSSQYRAHLSLYRYFLIEGINSIYQILTSHYGSKKMSTLLSGNSITTHINNEDTIMYFTPSGNSDFDLIRLYIQTFFPFHIVGSIIIID